MRLTGAGAATAKNDQVPAGDQPQDREGARPRSAADTARPRRRGDRIKPLSAAARNDANGTMRHFAAVQSSDAVGGEADIPQSRAFEDRRRCRLRRADAGRYLIAAVASWL